MRGEREREENINDGKEERVTISSRMLALLTALHTALPAHTKLRLWVETTWV